MYGKNIGSLNVYKRNEVGGSEQLLFSKQKEVGNYWQRLDLKITDSTRPFQVIVEAVRGDGNNGG